MIDMVDYKKVKELTKKKFDKLFEKISEVSNIVDKLEKSYGLEDEKLTLDNEWNKYCREYGVCAGWSVYPYKEKRDIVSIYKLHKNHPAIEIPSELKTIVDYIKVNSRTDKEIAMKVCGWVSTYIGYDNVHAAASRLYKERKNFIYMNAWETFETRVGICGEISLLTIGMLNWAGIPSTIYRPWTSHISVILRTRTGQHFMCDPTFDKFEEAEPITMKISKESYYEIGVSNVVENYKYNWSLRRKFGKEFGLKNYNRGLDVFELLDIERAHLCEELKYGTLVGLIEQQKMLGYCKKLAEKAAKEKAKKEKYLEEYNNFDWNKYLDDYLIYQKE